MYTYNLPNQPSSRILKALSASKSWYKSRENSIGICSVKKLLFATKIIAKNTNILPKKMQIKQKIAIAMMNSGSRKQNGYFSMYISVSKDYIPKYHDIIEKSWKSNTSINVLGFDYFGQISEFLWLNISKRKETIFFIFILNWLIPE